MGFSILNGAIIAYLLKKLMLRYYVDGKSRLIYIEQKLQFLEKKNGFVSDQLDEIKSSFKSIQASFFELDKKMTKPKSKK